MATNKTQTKEMVSRKMPVEEEDAGCRIGGRPRYSNVDDERKKSVMFRKGTVPVVTEMLDIATANLFRTRCDQTADTR